VNLSRETYRGNFINRGIDKIDLLFGFLLITNLILIFSEWIKRYDSLVGLSDEGFLFSQLISMKSTDSNYSPFAEILGIPFAWLGESIIEFRVFGLATVILVAILSLFFVRRSRNEHSKLVWTQIGIVSGVSILLVPSTFRFLLISPGYQWLITITSVLTFLTLIHLNTSKFLTPSIIVFSSAVLFLALQISLYTRVTYFFLLILMISISIFFLNKNPRRYLIIFLSLSLSFFSLTQNGLVSRWTEIISNASLIDPKGYSIFNEVIDISISILIILVTLTLGNILFDSSSNSRKQKVVLVGTCSLLLLMLLLWIFLSRDRMTPFAFLGTVLAGSLISRSELLQVPKIKLIYFVLLSLLPVTSQFGSNTPALANSNIVWISITFLAVTLVRISDREKCNRKMILACFLLLIALMQIVNTQRSFETSLDHSREVTIGDERFSTSEEISRAIKEFQMSFEKSGVPNDQRIMDLSMFHPGGGLYLGLDVIPMGTADRTFDASFDEQLNLLFSKYSEHFKGRFGLVLISSPSTKDMTLTSNCSELKNFLQLESQSFSSIYSEFLEYEYRTISILKSSPIQETLYPLDLRILAKCGG
jgi:hypothetical protein